MKEDPKCHYCGESLDELNSNLDHKIPRSKGGSNKKENLVLSCKKCNNKKADMMYEDFLNSLLKDGISEDDLL